MMNAETYREAFNLLCDEQIGRGMTRTVYSSLLLPDCVIKVENDSYRSHFQNIAEWQVWQMVRSTPAARWFAQCKWLSPDGRILIMERTRPALPKRYPDKVPVWFTDLKRSNWGLVDDNKGAHRWLVCHDYGTSLAIQEGTVTKRMRKAEWHDV